MSTLHDRLAALADEAPSGYADPALWEQGRRYGRRRRAGSLAIVAVTLLVLGLVVGASQVRSRTSIQPSGPASVPALPDRVVKPSPWLDGTDDAGPLGQLAALQQAERGGWFASRPGVVGISASTGEYRFLDLPDASTDPVALAPDGRRVAYWYTGGTRLSPNSESGPVVGVAVYDTSTGGIVRHAVPTDHGLWAESLVWADSDRLVFVHLQYRGGDDDDVMDQSSGDDSSGLMVWQPGLADPEPVSRGHRYSSIDGSDGQGRLLISGRPDVVLDLDDADRPRTIGRGGDSLAHISAISADGTRIASPIGSRNPNEIGVRSAAGRVIVPRSDRTFAVEAWLDDEHVAAVRRIGSGYERSGLFRVDVVSGESSMLLEFPRQTYGTSTQLATDLLATPPVERPEPPRPLGHWQLVSAIGFPTLFGLFALLLWRRRVRA